MIDWIRQCDLVEIVIGTPFSNIITILFYKNDCSNYHIKRHIWKRNWKFLSELFYSPYFCISHFLVQFCISEWSILIWLIVLLNWKWKLATRCLYEEIYYYFDVVILYVGILIWVKKFMLQRYNRLQSNYLKPACYLHTCITSKIMDMIKTKVRIVNQREDRKSNKCIIKIIKIKNRSGTCKPKA